MNKPCKVIILGLTLPASLFTLSFIAGYMNFWGSAALVRGAVERTVGVDRIPREAVELGGPDQLILFYFGSSDCPWSTQPEMPDLVQKAQGGVRAAADAHGLGFMSIGVAVDRSAKEGLSFLERIADFDQVASGGGYANILLTDLFSHDLPAIISVPQIVVVRRTLQGVDQENAALVGTQATVVFRSVGMREISAWVGRGSPVAAGMLTVNPDMERSIETHNQ